jgi:hypothetical protein
MRFLFQICGAETELAKCRKELSSFKKMEETYRSNPKFGNTNQLRKETEQVQELKKSLFYLRR